MFYLCNFKICIFLQKKTIKITNIAYFLKLRKKKNKYLKNVNQQGFLSLFCQSDFI